MVNIGGMLTPFAKKIKDDINGYPPFDDKFLLDFRKLKDLRFLVTMKPPFYFPLIDGSRFPLPNAFSIGVGDVKDKSNKLVVRITYSFNDYEGSSVQLW